MHAIFFHSRGKYKRTRLTSIFTLNHNRQVTLPGGPEGGQLWNYYVDGIASPREIELVALLLVNRADLVDIDKELKGKMRHLIGLFWDYDPQDGLESWEPPATVRTSGQALVDQVRGLVEGSVEDFHIGRITRLQSSTCSPDIMGACT